ncbi:MAG: PQQ-dependent dehydrogenase, methanol/ethanol family [Proteobacteria bacterium]|nr:PQQ-dependent dehydrogenase, methanol/ethanol family [Pseudomonadota bacterium]
MLNRTRILGLGLLLPLALAACQKTDKVAAVDPLANPAAVTQERLLKGLDDPTQWATYGGSYSEQRFSPLKQIDATSIGKLGLAWYADYDTNLDQNGTPLYVDGVIYVSTAWNKLYAFDAKTGKQLWQYNAKVPGEWLRNVCCGNVNRGLAAYNGKIYMGTLDARLVAIDAKTGKEAWSTDTIEGDHKDPLNRFSITMAPRVAKGKVYIGASGGEFSVRGWIAAYDAETGKQAWRFFNVPGDPSKGFENEAMKMAAATWTGEWWKLGGGASVWDATIYDPATDLIIYGTGNATPWNHLARGKKQTDSLFVASIVALKAETGEYVWHYQTTPGDTWDYDAVSPMMTMDLTIGGEKKHVLVQPNKNGMLYVLNVADGKLLSADAFTEVNWNTGVDMTTGRPKVVEAAKYEKEGWNLAPGVQGGHSWHPNAYSPDTGLIYIPTWESYFPMVRDPNYKPATGGFNLGISFAPNMTATNLKPTNKTGITGRLKAWDPVARKVVWETPPFTNNRPNGGALATAGGLVFAGNGAGEELRAYDAKNGTQLWSYKAQTAVYAGPITYELDGEQYIAQSVGGVAQGGYFAPGYARMLVFKIGGTATLPANQPYTPPPLNPPPSTASADVIKAGEDKYNQYCSVCHGADGVQQRGTFPNLMVSGLLHSQEGFDQVVLQGQREEKGMGNFSKDLAVADSAAVREYLISRANVLKKAAPPAPPPAASDGNQHQAD